MRRKCDLARAERVHVEQRSRHEKTLPVEVSARGDARSHGPEVAVVGERHALRSARRARGVEHHRRLPRLGADGRECPAVQERLEAVARRRVEVDQRNSGRNPPAALTVAEDEPGARVAQDELDGLA